MPLKYSCQCGACTAAEPFSRVKCEICGTGITFLLEGSGLSEDPEKDFYVPFTFRTWGEPWNRSDMPDATPAIREIDAQLTQKILDESLKRGHEYITRVIEETTGNYKTPLQTHHCLCGKARGLRDPERRCPHCGSRVVIPYA